MYSTSSQKEFWTLSSPDQIDRRRYETNAEFKSRFKSVLEPDEDEGFLSAAEEFDLCRIVTDTGYRFSQSFRPSMFPSTRWMAFAYFKRFFLTNSPLEYSPKNIMMVSFYLAAKVDEFNVSIDQFVNNLRSGTREGNMDTIVSLEPILLLKLEYRLAVHAPFRPMEGHLLNLKTSVSSQFDWEECRPGAEKFLSIAQLCDAILLFSPTHLALAAIQQGLAHIDDAAQLINRYIDSILFPNNADQAAQVIAKLTEIATFVNNLPSLADDANGKLQVRMKKWFELRAELDQRSRNKIKSKREEELASDDE